MQLKSPSTLRLIGLSVLFGFMVFATTSCYQCYTCTGQTDFGEVEKELCGRKGDISPLIQHLESDTNPWVCEKQ